MASKNDKRAKKDRILQLQKKGQSEKHPIDVAKLVSNATVKACRKQVLLFAKLAKQTMLKQNLGAGVINDIVNDTFDAYKDMSTFQSECEEAIREALKYYTLPQSRGKDPLGRLLIEHCFARLNKPALHPEGATLDKQSREKFIAGVMPRPVIRYFLVSLRGTVHGVDKFYSRPLLFSNNDDRFLTMRATADKLVESHRIHFTDGKEVVDWESVYDDQGSKRLILGLSGSCIDKISTLGAERYLRVLENIESKDRNATKQKSMKRPMFKKDVQQLLSALKKGHHQLVEELNAN